MTLNKLLMGKNNFTNTIIFGVNLFRVEEKEILVYKNQKERIFNGENYIQKKKKGTLMETVP